MSATSPVPHASSHATPRAENNRVTRVLRRFAFVPLMLITAYLVMERSHAEELGGGVRATSEVLRGDRALSPLTWAALAAVLITIGWTMRSARAAGVPRRTVR